MIPDKPEETMLQRLEVVLESCDEVLRKNPNNPSIAQFVDGQRKIFLRELDTEARVRSVNKMVLEQYLEAIVGLYVTRRLVRGIRADGGR